MEATPGPLEPVLLVHLLGVANRRCGLAAIGKPVEQRFVLFVDVGDAGDELVRPLHGRAPEMKRLNSSCPCDDTLVAFETTLQIQVGSKSLNEIDR